jgi:L-asparaginase/Glu-tRNA(Gln) amidotransferase subunit D
VAQYERHFERQSKMSNIAVLPALGGSIASNSSRLPAVPPPKGAQVIQEASPRVKHAAEKEQHNGAKAVAAFITLSPEKG